MSAQYAAEKEGKNQSVDDAAGPDMPSRLAYQKGEHTATYPNGKENVGSYVSVKIEKTPR